MRILFAVILLSCLALSSGLAQETHGHLQGQVLETGGAPVATVEVMVTGDALPGERATTTNREGYFYLRWLPVGSYTVTLRRLGYQNQVLRDVLVRLGRTTTMGEIRLTVAPIEVEELQARAERLLIDPVSTAAGVNLTPDLYDNLPLARDYQSLVAVAPQAHQYVGVEQSIAGGTGPETKYYIEGVDVTDPAIGTGITLLPYNFVREVEVRTGGYEAEYESSLGGVVNIITYSGGNDYRGQAFGFYTSDRLEGSPRFGLSELTKASSSKYDLGGTFGGPILRDRLWFFAAYNPSFLQEAIEIPGHGLHEDRTVWHRFAGKVTWQATPTTNVHLTVFGDPGGRDVVQPMSSSTAHFTPENPETWLGKEESGGVNVALGAAQLLGSSGLLEASLSAMDRTDNYLPTTEKGYQVQFHDYTTETVSGGTTYYGEESLGRSALRLKATWQLGHHTLKAGGQLSIARHETRSSTHHVIKKYGPTTYREVEIMGSGTVRSRVGGLFLQDSWQLTDRWRLNAGLRWEAQALIDSNGDIAQTISDEFQPRIGFVVQTGRLGTQRLYGSVGRYYQDLALNAASFYFDGEVFYRWTKYDHDPRVDPAGGEVISEFGAVILDPTRGLKGQYYDEIALGYERQLSTSLKLGARGTYQTLRRAVEDGMVSETGEFVIGNPGFGLLGEYPEAKREHASLALVAEKTLGQGLLVIASYVLSRTYGNYQGLFDTDYWVASPNSSADFDHPDLMENGEGLLPQDRRHSFKLAASYATNFGLTAGLRFLWQSGTPLSVRGGSTQPPMFAYLRARGSAGRTPSIWDLDFRLAYDFRRLLRRDPRTRLILDVFNVGSPRTPVALDEVAYFTLTDEGLQADPNANYGEPTRYQPPMTVRLGIEVGL